MNLWQPAPVPEWQTPGDPRAKIRIADLLRMSSGLRIRAPYDPEYDASGPIPIIFTCTPAASIPFTMRRLALWNGLPTRWAVIETPTPCSSIIWFVSPWNGAARIMVLSPSGRSSTR